MSPSVFDSKKEIALNKLSQAISENKVDLGVLALVHLINSFSNYYTTSSCAGRIVILSKDNFRGKYSATFIFKKHSAVTFGEIKQIFLNDKPINYTLLYLNVEPPTIHIASRSLTDAIAIHQLALTSRLGYSMFKTVKKTIIVEVRGTGLLQIPIGRNNELLISDSYLKFLLNHANEILIQEQERLIKFQELLKQAQLLAK